MSFPIKEAIALLLILEGLMPLIALHWWREMFTRILRFNDGQLRFVGLAAAAVGMLLLWF